jgi:hypothetical protein
VVSRPDPWKRFLQALVKVYTRRGHEQDFIQRLAEAIIDLVEGQRDPGIIWDSLISLSDAIRLAWDLTEDLYAEQDGETAQT